MIEPSSLKKQTVVSGVYFLFKRQRLVYIGRSHNIHKRIGTHDHRGKFDNFSYIPCTVKKSIKLEISYIKKYQPPLNAKRGEGLLAKTVYLPDALFRKIKRYARKNGITFSAAVCRLLEEATKNEG